MDLSNQVVTRINGDGAGQLPRRTLDLEKILTPELGLLSPRRIEIAPRGSGRYTALVAYSERLRQSYRVNEGGIRDGMLKLGEAYRNGQAIAVSCFCRAGEMCHADVVKMAIEKVGRSLVQEASHHRPREVAEPAITGRFPNPRTQRAVNEILSVGRTDLLLAKLDDTDGRNRSEHASLLNRQSQFVRDLYERGAVIRDGVLIVPQESPSVSRPLAVESIEYALKKLAPLVNETRAKESGQQIVEYGSKIAGASADRDTKIKVFNWIYGALEGRNDLLKADDKVPEAETKEEGFDRTLKEIASLAEEMNRLEPSDRSVYVEQMIELEGGERERADDRLVLESVYEDAIPPGEYTGPIESDAAHGIQEFERVELEDTTLSRLAGNMSNDELEKWVNVRLPVLDELLETGTPVDAILKPFQNGIYQAVKHNPVNKKDAVDDLRFASAYVKHQLTQPESRLRHFNPRYRDYASMLERAASREEVIDVASHVRLENAQLGFRWNDLREAEKGDTPRPLTSKEMQYLFTEISPRHYTSEMTAARLAYLNAGEAARTKTDALMRGEIVPSKEAVQLVESLESRMERKNLKDSLSATKHFLQSLKTPNDDLRYKNSFDHSEVYRKLPPAERDFIYQQAALQKEKLESRIAGDDSTGQSVRSGNENMTETVNAFRSGIKAEIIGLFEEKSHADNTSLSEQIGIIVEKNFERIGSEGRDLSTFQQLGRELGESVTSREVREREPYSHSVQRDSTVAAVNRQMPVEAKIR